MNKLASTLVLAAQTVLADAAPEVLVDISEVSIERCVSEYERVTDRTIPDSIDRVYVRVYQSPAVAAAFVHGEVGTFGATSSDYFSVFVCIADTSPGRNYRVVHISETLQEALIGDEEEFQNMDSRFAEEEEAGLVTEVMFLRSGSRFEIAGYQTFSLENMEKHNPNRANRVPTRIQ